MNKRRKVISNSLVVIILFTLLFTNPLIVRAKNNTEKKIILIDPGHGGMDGGAVSKNGTIEKNINLSIGLKLKEILEKDGYQVLMTRDEDKGLHKDKGTVRNKKNEDLNNRCKLRRESGCDMFISIHLNIFPQSKYYGAQIWYSSYEESKKFAEIMQDNFKLQLDNSNNRKAKPALDQYKILRDNLKIPSVIVECGFLSNPQEEEKLKAEEYQKQLAEVIAKSIKDYYGR